MAILLLPPLSPSFRSFAEGVDQLARLQTQSGNTFSMKTVHLPLLSSDRTSSCSSFFPEEEGAVLIPNPRHLFSKRKYDRSISAWRRASHNEDTNALDRGIVSLKHPEHPLAQKHLGLIGRCQRVFESLGCLLRDQSNVSPSFKAELIGAVDELRDQCDFPLFFDSPTGKTDKDDHRLFQRCKQIIFGMFHKTGGFLNSYSRQVNELTSRDSKIGL